MILKPKYFIMILLLLFVFSITSAKEIQLEKEFFDLFKYREIGPTRQSGRFVDFAVSRQNPTTFYAATGSGGLWKTTNNGTTFTALFTKQNIFSIGDIAIAPSDENILYLGSGEANNSRSTYWGDGIYKSLDAGKTWKNIGLKESHHIGRILIHPSNPDIVYIAALGHLYSHNPERGMYKTVDGGKTWEKVLEVKESNRYISIVDAAMDPKNPEILYACAYDRHRRPWTYDIGGPGSGIYKTSDAGKTWKKLAGGLPTGILGRIGIAVYAKNPQILYTTIENANKPNMSVKKRWKEIQKGKSSRGMIGGEVFRSDDGGETWKKVSPDKKSIGGAPAYYYGQIIIDPVDDKIVHILSASSWGTYDGGKTWKRRPLNFGGDDHALWIDPNNTRHMLLGYDHGMGISYDGGKTWMHPDNQSLAQFYAIGLDMSYPYNIAGGLQDNGSVLGPSTKKDGSTIKFEDWKRVGGGDGMYNVFDWKNNLYLYNESQFGPISRLNLKTGERRSIRYRDSSLRFNWNSPILISPHNSDVIYHGANKILKSKFRGEKWEVISPDLSKNDKKQLTTGKGGDGNIQYCTITSFDESPIREGVLWAGTDDGNLWVKEDKDWKKLNANVPDNPEYWVSRVVASHHHLNTAYVSYNGYRRDDFSPFIYKTTDFGKTWTKITNGLPQAPVNVVVESQKNPDLLFAGTDMGVYLSMNGGLDWINFELNMPRQPVHDIKIHPRENDLVVATHGRGIFITNIYPLLELNNELLKKKIHLFDIRTKVKWQSKIAHVYSSANFQGPSEAPGANIHYYLKKKFKKDPPLLFIYDGIKMINKLKISNNAGINKAYWDLTRLVKRSKKDRENLKKQVERYKKFGYNMKVDLDYEHIPVKPGNYRAVLRIGKKEFTKPLVLLKDRWND